MGVCVELRPPTHKSSCKKCSSALTCTEGRIKSGQAGPASNGDQDGNDWSADTRAELREELNLLREELREHYATKEDLAKLEAQLKTDVNRGHYVDGWYHLLGLTAVAAIMRLLS